jgi:hypothetical protein
MTERDDPLQSILVAYLEAVEAGRTPDRPELLARHPEFAAELTEFLANLDRIERVAAPLRPPVLLGTVRYFGDYELLEEIARGGMGVVYRARQVSLDRTVAVKMVLNSELADDVQKQRFRREAEAVAQLDHPNIVPVFEVGEHDGQSYFSMAFVEGGSLAGRIAGGPLPPREAAELVEAIARAAQFAHERGVVHRDLKPANILLDSEGRPRVSDFGLAKHAKSGDSLTSTGAIVGTPGYMAPEQAAGKTNLVGPLSDVYGLGAILYALLTGRPPFQAATDLETVLQVIEDDPIRPGKLNPAVPRDLETICLKCLQKQPEQRYERAQELANDLGRFLRHEPIKARRPHLGQRAWAWLVRRPWAATAAMLIGLLGLLVATYALTSRLRQRDAEVLLLEARVDRLTGRYDQATDRLRRAAATYVRPDQFAEGLEIALDRRQSARRLREASSAARGLEGSNTIQVSDDGRLLLLGEKNYLNLERTFRLLELPSGRVIHDVRASQAALDASGRRFASFARPSEENPHWERRLTVWDIPENKVSAQVDVGFLSDMADLAFAPDGSRLFWIVTNSGTSEHTTRESPGLTTLTGKTFTLPAMVARFSLHVWDMVQPPRVIARDVAAEWDRRDFLSVSNDGGVVSFNGFEEALAWRTADGAEILRLPWKRTRNRLVLHPDGRRAAVIAEQADHVRLLDLASGDEISRLEASAFREEAPWYRRDRTFGNPLHFGGKASFSTEGRYFAALGQYSYKAKGAPPQVVVWDLATRHEALRLPADNFATPPGQEGSLLTLRLSGDAEDVRPELQTWQIDGTRDELADAGLLGLMTMPPEAERTSQSPPYPFNRLQEVREVGPWLAALLSLAPLLFVPVFQWRRPIAAPFGHPGRSIPGTDATPTPMRYRTVFGVLVLALVAVLLFLPSHYYLVVAFGVVPLAWLSTYSLKRDLARGNLPSAAGAVGFLVIGMLNLAMGLYFLATFLATPGFPVGELLCESFLVAAFVLIGLQTVELALRSYHDRVGGLIRRDGEEMPATVAEMVLHGFWQAGSAWVALCVLALPVLVVWHWTTEELTWRMVWQEGLTVLFALYIAYDWWQKRSRRAAGTVELPDRT